MFARPLSWHLIKPSDAFLSRSHWIWQGCRQLITFGETLVDHVRPAGTVTNQGAVPAITLGGRGWDFAGATAGALFPNPVIGDVDKTATFVMEYEWPGTWDHISQCSGISSATILINSSGHFRVGGATTTDPRLNFNGAGRVFTTITVVHNQGTGFDFWRDGVLIESLSYGSWRFNSAVSWGGYHSASPLDGKMFFACVHEGLMDPARIASLHQDILQIYRPMRSRRYGFPAAGGEPSVSVAALAARSTQVVGATGAPTGGMT